MILSLWDNLLDDQDLIADLARVHEDFRLIDKTRFFWYPRAFELDSETAPVPPAGRAPQNPIERLAEVVIATVRPPSLAGVEYWTNSLPSGAAMPMHQDKDEKLYWTSQQLSHPLISTVYYPIEPTFTGGQLVVNGEHLLYPHGNQLAAFKGTFPHGVQSVKSGTRHSIALNLWASTPVTYQD